MGLFDFFKNNSNNNNNKSIIEKHTDSSYSSSISSLYGVSNEVDEETVLQIPTVQSCKELISSTIAQLPIYLYKETEDGSVEKIAEDYRVKLLNDEPNEFQSGYNLKKHIVSDYLFYGSSYTYVEREGNHVHELTSLPGKNVKVDRYIQDGFKVVDADINLITTSDGKQLKSKSRNKFLNTFKPHECIVILKDSNDGITSKGILHYGKDVFKVALEEKSYTSTIYKNGALPLGVLQTDGRLSEGIITRLRESWSNLYAGAQNAGKTVILEEGLKYSPVSLKPGDLLLTDNRKDVVSDICKLFNLPESLIDVSKIKYGSLEQNNIQFLQYTLNPILTSIENGINKSLLLEEEKRQG